MWNEEISWSELSDAVTAFRESAKLMYQRITTLPRVSLVEQIEQEEVIEKGTKHRVKDCLWHRRKESIRRVIGRQGGMAHHDTCLRTITSLSWSVAWSISPVLTRVHSVYRFFRVHAASGFFL